jgi:hypothetical protein
MRHGGQRSRRFERRERERKEKKALMAMGRKAKREHERQKRGEVLTQAGRLAMVYAFRYALKQRSPGLDNVQAAMEQHLHEFRTEVLEHMVTDIDVHWAMAAHEPARYALTRREQEDFRAMLVREIERRKRDGQGRDRGHD